MSRLLRASSLLAFFLGWEIVVRLADISPLMLPPISVIFVTFFDLVVNGDLLLHAAYSLSRAFAGLGLATLLAIPLGLIMGWSKLADDICSPILELFRPIPSIALIPVAILWLGIGHTSKIFIIFFACFFPILLNTYSGVKGTDPNLIRVARSMGAGEVQILRGVVLPSSLPMILTGFRIAVAVSLILIVAAEMVAARYGLGFMILYSEVTFRSSSMYAGILTLGIIGYTLNDLTLRLERYLLRWRPGVAGVEDGR